MYNKNKIKPITLKKTIQEKIAAAYEEGFRDGYDTRRMEELNEKKD